MIQQRQHMDGVGCCTFVIGLTSMFVFEILQISMDKTRFLVVELLSPSPTWLRAL